MDNWISVKDRLPENETEHCSIDCNFTDGENTFCGYRYFDISEGNITWFDFISRTNKDNITHWMPLPEPPK